MIAVTPKEMEEAIKKVNSTCDFCSKDNVLMKKEVPCVIWGTVVDEPNEIFVIYDDRGYLRLGYDDFNCLDHGEKFKINYCPICGRRLD